MTGVDWARLPLLALMLVLLITGAAGLLRDDQSPAAVVLLTAAMVTLGAWLTIETISWHHRLHHQPDTTHPQEEDPHGEPSPR